MKLPLQITEKPFWKNKLFLTPLKPDSAVSITPLKPNSAKSTTPLKPNSAVSMTLLKPNSVVWMTLLKPNSAASMTPLKPNSAVSITKLKQNSAVSTTPQSFCVHANITRISSRIRSHIRKYVTGPEKIGKNWIQWIVDDGVEGKSIPSHQQICTEN